MALIDDVQIRALFIEFDVLANPSAGIAAMKAKLSFLNGMQSRHVVSSSYMGNGVNFGDRNGLNAEVAKYVYAIERAQANNLAGGFRPRRILDGSGLRDPYRGRWR